MYWMQKVLKRNLSSIPFYDIQRERESHSVYGGREDGMGRSMHNQNTHNKLY